MSTMNLTVEPVAVAVSAMNLQTVRSLFNEQRDANLAEVLNGNPVPFVVLGAEWCAVCFTPKHKGSCS